MSSSALLPSGTVVADRYRIDEALAGEGSAAIFRATDTRAERMVALRLVATGGAADDRERSVRQGKAAARLMHPNLARVLDFGVDGAAGVQYTAAELETGGSLAALLAQRGTPPLPLALRLVQEAAAGLAVAHAAGAVHGDLHPGMLWLSRGDGKLRTQVLGLGIDPAGAPTSRSVGRYAAPERLRRVRDLTPAADVFSLAVIAYDVLAGLPADWNTLLVSMARGQATIIPPPAAARPELPAHVSSAIIRALSASPADRWTDGGDLAAALAAGPAEASIAPRAVPAVATPPAAAQGPIAIRIPAIFAEPEPARESVPSSDIVSAAAVVPEPIVMVDAAPVIPEPIATVDAAPVIPEPIVTVDSAPVIPEPVAPVDVAPVEPTAPKPAPVNVERTPAPARRTGPTHQATLSSTDLADSLYIPPTFAQKPAAAPAARSPLEAATPIPAPPANPVPAPAVVAVPAAAAMVTVDETVVAPEVVRNAPEETTIAAPTVAHVTVAQVDTERPGLPETAVFMAASAPAALTTEAPPIPVAPLKLVREPVQEQTVAAAPSADAQVVPMRRSGLGKLGKKPGNGQMGMLAAGVVLALVVGGGIVATTKIGGADPTNAVTARLASKALAGTPELPSAGVVPAPSADAAPAEAAPTIPGAPALTADEQRKQDEERRRVEELRKQQQRRADSLRAAQTLAQAQPAAAPQQAAAPMQAAPRLESPAPTQAAPRVAVNTPAPSAPEAAPAAARPDPNRVYGGGEVDRTPTLRNRPELQRAIQRSYPATLEGTRVAGGAVVQFVVLPDGRVDRGSIRVVETSHPAFRSAAAGAIGAARFNPAQVNGQAVRAEVSMPLTWNPE